MGDVTKADLPICEPGISLNRADQSYSYISLMTAVFLALSVVILTPLVWAGLATGSILVPEEMGRAQTADPSIIALPFDLRYWGALKLQRVADEQPEVIWVGSSRGEALRAAMFAPYRFYNASLTTWTLDQQIAILDHVTRVSKPRIVMLGIDYFMFTDQYADGMNRERSMVFDNGLRYRIQALFNLVRQAWTRPALIGELISDWRAGRIPVRDRGATFLGMDAIRGVTGFRADGSMLISRGNYARSAQQVADNVGILEMAPGGPSIAIRQYRALKRLAGLARERGVTLVAVQLPMYKATVDFLDQSTNAGYAGLWREFESETMQRTLKELGFAYLDLSHDSMIEDGGLFLDAAHPTESGAALVVMRLLADPQFQALLPLIDGDRLQADRQAAFARGDKFEVYGHQSAN
jgi:hypothetical protein